MENESAIDHELYKLSQTPIVDKNTMSHVLHWIDQRNRCVQLWLDSGRSNEYVLTMFYQCNENIKTLLSIP